MTYQNLTPKQTYIVSIAPGEEIMEVLSEFIKNQKIKSGYIIGIGAVTSARLGWYSVPQKKYFERKVKKPLEITNLIGIITSGKIHIHATFSSQMLKAYAGHLTKANVSGACELIVVETKEAIKRKHSEQIGLELLNLV